MHITIYGITEDPENMDSLTESDIDEDTYAAYYYDYWHQIEKPLSTLAEWFAEEIGGKEHRGITIGEDDTGCYLQFTEEALNDYFHEMYVAFREAVKDLDQVKESQMRSWIEPAYRLKAIMGDDFGTKVYDYYNGWLTVVDFMRYANAGKKYYVVGALDAHQ